MDKSIRSQEGTVSVVSATRLPEREFWKKSALGQSLARLCSDRRLRFHITFENKEGLPDIYNHHLLNATSQYIVFIHDDVWIDDFFLVDRVIDGLSHYNVIGVIGSIRRLKNQPSWAFIDTNLTWDERSYFSGAIAHGDHPLGEVVSFKSPPADCELLDGVFIAACRCTLVERGITFDPRFKFHFYDMDFCRTVREKELRIGTWPICLTHQSGGAFGSEAWRESLCEYLKKWGD
jgi:Glycosyltransferase like family